MRVQLKHRPRSRERGAIAILTAVLSVVLVAVAAFAVDFGMAYSQRQALYTGVDAAALSVVQSFKKSEIATPRNCNALKTFDAGLASGNAAKSDTIALTSLNTNSPFGQSISASDITVTTTCVGSGNTVMQVNVAVKRTISTSLGRIIGVNSLDVNRNATADLGVANDVAGLRPVGVCTYQAQQIVTDAEADKAAGNPYRAEIIGLTKVWQGNKTCDGAGGSGNWGWLDLGQGNGANALGDAIASGAPTTLGLTVNPSPSPASVQLGGNPGNKGNSANIHSGFTAIMDKTVVLPVYNTYADNGSNATYQVIGFLSVKVCGYDNIHGSCYDSTQPTGTNDIQVRFASYSPVGTIDDVCGIGTICSNDTYVTRLVK